MMSELVKHNEVSVQFRFMCREIDGVYQASCAPRIKRA
ncbi:hypothetical protein [Vibrio phage J14]|nr:hypothetical protein [Vibrio phage J14]